MIIKKGQCSISKIQSRGLITFLIEEEVQTCISTEMVESIWDYYNKEVIS